MARYWFKPKTYGYGATPASWQGWVATGAFVLLILAARVLTTRLISDRLTAELTYWSLFCLLLLGLVGLCTLKGDGMWRWRWGRDD